MKLDGMCAVVLLCSALLANADAGACPESHSLLQVGMVESRWSTAGEPVPQTWGLPPDEEAGLAEDAASHNPPVGGPRQDAHDPIALLDLNASANGAWKIRNKRSGSYLLAGSWGTRPEDHMVWQFPKNMRYSGDTGFLWKVHHEGTVVRIQNRRSGQYLLAGSWGDLASDRSVWQYPEEYHCPLGSPHFCTSAKDWKRGFEWELLADGRIRNQRSGFYLLAGSWGDLHSDRSVWQFPEHERKNGKQGFVWEFEWVEGQ